MSTSLDSNCLLDMFLTYYRFIFTRLCRLAGSPRLPGWSPIGCQATQAGAPFSSPPTSQHTKSHRVAPKDTSAMRIAVWTFLASALASLAGTGQTEAAPAPPALFAPPSSSFLQPNIASHPNGIARRSTRSNIAVLDSALLARDPAEITLNLFEGTSLVALRTGGAMNAETGVRIWEGSIEGSDTGSVVITSTNGVVAGSVRTLEGTFNISPLGGLHGIYQLNVSAFPAEGHSKVPERPARQSARQNAGVTGSPRAAPGQVNVIDIMFLVTPAVVQFAAGSEAAALAGINTMIAEANKAYVDGNIPAMLRVVHVEFVNYIEFGDMLVDLNRLTSSDDGFMDNVHYLRDKYRADLVSMLTMDVDLCGMAWTMDSTLIGPDMAEYGFSVVDYSCGASVMSLAHEVGHNMGGLLVLGLFFRGPLYRSRLISKQLKHLQAPHITEPTPVRPEHIPSATAINRPTRNGEQSCLTTATQAALEYLTFLTLANSIKAFPWESLPESTQPTMRGLCLTQLQLWPLLETLLALLRQPPRAHWHQEAKRRLPDTCRNQALPTLSQYTSLAPFRQKFPPAKLAAHWPRSFLPAALSKPP